MRYCKTCKINYDTDLEHCILCGGDLTHDHEDHSTYKFQEVTKAKKTNFFFRFFIFLNVISALITLIIDFVTGTPLSWSLIVTATNIYTIMFIVIVINPNFWASKFTKIVVFTILIVVLLGLSINEYTWAVDIVFPIAVFSTIFLNSLMIITNRKRWFDYLAPLLLMTIIGLIPGLLIIFNVLHIEWPSIVCFTYAAVTLLGIVFLPSKSAREEFHRRFHI